jgi:acyl carrier protein
MTTPLLEVIASVMEVPTDQIDENSCSDTLEKWDSMRQIMLASMLESEYSFILSSDEMEQLKSVRQIRAILAAHGMQDGPA